jgi:hypothetical protein
MIACYHKNVIQNAQNYIANDFSLKSIKVFNAFFVCRNKNTIFADIEKIFPQRKFKLQ